MKNIKKTIVAVSLSAIMLATAGVGTLAYFTSTATPVTNTFTVGKVDIALTEPDWKPENGRNIVPGSLIPKNPTVTVAANSVGSYVRMTLTMSPAVYNACNLKPGNTGAIISFGNVSGGTFGPGIDSNKWELVQTVTSGGSVVVSFDYKGIVAPTTLEPLFTHVKIAESATEANFIPIGNDFNVDVAAYAVQALGFDSASAAFAGAFGRTFTK